MGSAKSNDGSAKRNDKCLSKYNQPERNAKGQMKVVGCNKFTSYIVHEDANADLWTVEMRKDGVKSNSPQKDGWNKYVIEAKKDCNSKEEAVGWPSWGTTTNHSSEQCTRSADTCEDYSMECKIGLNVSEDGKMKRETFEGSDIFEHDGIHGLGQSNLTNHMVEKGSLSMLCWDKADVNGEEKNVGWPSWDGTRSKTIIHQNGKGAWNQSCGWSTSKNGTTMTFGTAPNKSEDGKTKRQTRGGGYASDHNGIDGWNQSNPNIHLLDKDNLKKSSYWDRTEDGNGKKESRGWSNSNLNRPKTVGLYTDHQNGKGGWNVSQELSTLEVRGSLKKSECWERPEDGNWKESGRWPPWDGSSSKAIGLYMDTKNGKNSWNQSKRWPAPEDDTLVACEGVEAKVKRETSERDVAFHLDGIEESKQSNPNVKLDDKESLSKSYWDRMEGGNEKETEGWPGWDASVSTTAQQCGGLQNRNVGWNHSQGWNPSDHGDSWKKDAKVKRETTEHDGAFRLDGNEKFKQSNPIVKLDGTESSSKSCWDRMEGGNEKETEGWPSWDASVSMTAQHCGRRQNINAGWNHLQGWNPPDYGDSWKKGAKVKMETSEHDDAFHLDGIEESKQSNPNVKLDDKESSSKSCWDRMEGGNESSSKSCWDRMEGGNEKKAEGWSSWDASVSRQNRNVSWNHAQVWNPSDHGDPWKKDGVRNQNLDQMGDPWLQHGWNKSATWSSSRGDNFGRNRKKWGAGLDRTGCDSWKQLTPTILTEAGRKKCGSWTAQDENCFRKKHRWIRSPGFSGSDALKQHRPRRVLAMSKPSGQGPNLLNRIWDRNKSRGKTSAAGGNFLNKDGCKNTKHDTSDQPWMQQRSKLPPKCAWNNTASWIRSGNGSFEGDCRSWDPALDQTADDPWKECSPTLSSEFDERQPENLTLNKSSSFREQMNCSTASGSVDLDASHQNKFTLLPKIGGKRLFRDSSSILFRASEHGCNQSNDGCKKGAGVASANCRYSPGGTSRRGSQIRHDIANSVRQNSGRNIVGFRDSKRANYLGHESGIRSENPGKQRDYLQDIISPTHQSNGDGAEESAFSKNDKLFDGCNHEANGIVSSWDGLNIRNITVGNQLRQSHTMMLNDGFKDETTKFMVPSPKQDADREIQNSPDFWKIQQKDYICQQTTRNTCSPPYNQIVDIQCGQNVQVNSQLSSTHGFSNLKDKVQHHEQQEMLISESFRKNDGIPDASTMLDLNAQSFTDLSLSVPVREAFTPATEGSSSSNLLTRFSPLSIKPSTSSEEQKANARELLPVDKYPNTDPVKLSQSIPSRIITETMTCQTSSNTWNPSHYETSDDKGVRMFKVALVEFVKNIIKPVWKEGGLSKEAHKTVVKKVVDKVTGVLGTNIPHTQEMIDQYMTFANGKLHKLTQDYLKMFINT